MTSDAHLGLAGCFLALACQRSTPGRSVAPADTIAEATGSQSAAAVIKGAPALESAARPTSLPDSIGVIKVTQFLGSSCALEEGGLAYCWAPPTSPLTEGEGDAVPRRVPELDGARSFAKSSYFSYFVDASGQVQIWSKDRHSYLGDISQPKRLPSLQDVTQVQTTGDMAYALQSNGNVMWWSDSFVSPEAGEAGTVVSDRPELAATRIRGLAPVFNSHYLAQDGSVYHREGAAQSKIVGVTDAQRVADCAAIACALDSAKRARCWHRGRPSPSFELHASAPVTSLACAGGADVFALLNDGTVVAATERFAPIELTRIPSLENVAELALCRGTLSCPHCVKLRSGVVSCWGEGQERKLGLGEWPKDPRFVPLQKGRDVTTPRGR